MPGANGEFNEGSEKIERIRFSRSPRTKPGNDFLSGGRPQIDVFYATHRDSLRHRFVRHSPDGFEFGYGGSGPADTALNILTLFIPIEEAELLDTHYEEFKFQFVARIDREKGGAIEAEAIRAWVRQRRLGVAVPA